jgi:deoxyadenosine/deoxycytidine kinase
LGYGLAPQKELRQLRKLFYQNPSKYAFALQLILQTTAEELRGRVEEHPEVKTIT